MSRVFIFALLFITPAVAFAEAFHIHIINAEANITKKSVLFEVEQGLKTLRRETKGKFRIASYREVIDTSLSFSSEEERFLHLERKYDRRGSRNIVIIFYNSSGSAYGVTRLCSTIPVIGIGIAPRLPRLWVKLVVAHEVGHILGSDHRVDYRAYLNDDHPPINIMFPNWGTFFRKLDIDLAKWKFSSESKLEFSRCGALRSLNQGLIIN